MSTGYKNLRSFCRILHFHHIKFDPLSRLEYFTFDLLIFCEHCIRLTKVDADITSYIALHDSGHDILFLLEVLVVNNFALFFPDLLKNQVLCVLRRDPAKGLGINRHLDNVAQLILRVHHFCVHKANLLFWIVNFLHNGLLRINCEITSLPVHHDFNIVRFFKMVLAGVHQGILNSIQHRFLADVFFLFQYGKSLH